MQKANTKTKRSERLKKAKEQKASNADSSWQIDDLLTLSDLSEENLLRSLHSRYDHDLIYTFVGPILISINPYRSIDNMYSEATMDLYHRNPNGNRPHVFETVKIAYEELILSSATSPNDQSIIISGESGAGKTETTKVIMQYLARVTTSGHINNGIVSLEQKVLDSNPLLESFGNAKTLRNDNSSRFGKFIEIQFDKHGKIAGAEIMNFLLEKTRIVTQSLNERNYHIFYQLLAGAGDELREQLNLKQPEDYEYLKHSGCFVLPSKNDKAEFELTKQCMSTIGISLDMQTHVFEMLAAILHLGNVDFDVKQEACVPSNENSMQCLALVARLLQVSDSALQAALCTRQLFVGGKVIVQTQNAAQARDKRDALAKTIYSSLFMWLVTELNRTISQPSQKWGFIGVLDIYGFEKFDWNTFEQLCINFANEKLQRHFNQHMLEVEQEEYTREGIDWAHIKFQDNQGTLELLEGKPNGKPGVFIALDDVWRMKGDEANRKFVSYLHSTFGASHHDSYIQPKVDAAFAFGIRHYAGDVIYDASGFNDKNNEDLNDDMKELIKQSTNSWLPSMVDSNLQAVEAISRRASTKPAAQNAPSRRPSENAGNDKKTRTLREISVGAQFRYQLQELMSKISRATPRYIRCIKPNEEKLPRTLDGAQCVRQLKYSGMMEAIQIRQKGFGLREDHDVFFYDYLALAPSSEDINELVSSISEMLNEGKDQWQMGTTKVFLKRSVAEKLKKLKLLREVSAVRTLQRWHKILKQKSAAITIQSAVRSWRAQKELGMLRSAAYIVMKMARGFAARSKYKKLVIEHRRRVECAIQIQAHVRGFLVRQKDLLHPFAGMSPKDLDLRIKEIEAAIEEAAKQKQFEKCSTLQKELDSTLEARRLVRTPKEVDAEIASLMAEMERLAAQKKFAECSAVQSKLVTLQEFRRSMPEDLNELESHELDARIASMNEDIVKAMADRQFELCGQLQEKLDKLVVVRKTKQTPAEMEAEIANLTMSLSQAMQRKEFDKCAQIQTQLDLVQARLAKISPPRPPATPQKSVASPVDVEKVKQATHASGSINVTGQISTKPVVINAGTTKPVVVAGPPLASHPIATHIQASAAPVVVAPVVNALPTVNVAPQVSVGVKKTSFHVENRNIGETRRGRSNSIESTTSAHSQAYSVSSRASHAVSVSSKLSRAKSSVKPSSTIQETEDSSRTVARLRPARAVNMSGDITVTEAAQLMKKNRTAAALIVSPSGGLEGILSDTDVTRRVVGKGLDPSTTLVSSIMTPSPTCVASEDKASYALSMMLQGRFRHLPVIDSNSGSVTGVLNVTKCLHAAIRRLEQAHETSKSLKKDLNVSGAALAILGPMLERLSSPTLQDIVTVANMPPLVFPDDMLQDVIDQMAETRKAALVIDEDGVLLGILTPKDVLVRVIAAGISTRTTRVEKVMTSDPEAATTKTTIIDAFHIMHDGKFLNLPIVDDNGVVVGLTDVLSLACHAFSGSEGDQFGQFAQASFQNDIDFDDNASVASTTSNASKASRIVGRKKKLASSAMKSTPTPVSSLQPAPAHTISDNATVQECCQLMRSKLTDAVLIVGGDGSLLGILTDNDICRRVVGANLSVTTKVSQVMTPNIKYVGPNDNALDAMVLMHEGHFRHLPVVDQSSVVGILSIGKCLFDAIKRLEQANVATQALQETLEQQLRTSQLKSAIGPMMDKMLSTSLTLSTIMQKDTPAPQVTRQSTVQEAVYLMAQTRKAALVLEGQHLIGLFSPNELTIRVIAQGLNPATTMVGDVMLLDPEFGDPDMPVLEAMQIMHESACLNLPVLLENGQVAGLVDVLSMSYGSFSIIYGDNREKLEEFWNASFQIDQSMIEKPKPKPASVERTVASLRPTKAVTVPETLTIRELSRTMVREKTDAVLVISSSGSLAGIVTGSDLTNRVVSRNLSPDTTLVHTIMTPQPQFVTNSDSAIDALCTMLAGKFRHLPVVDNDSMVVGVLHIAKCLYDAIRKVESTTKSTSRELASNPRLKRLGPMVQRLFSPDVQSILDGDIASPRILPYTSIYAAAKLMAETKKAALVVDERGQLLGMITPDHMLSNVLAKSKPIHTTAVCDVMVQSPQCVYGSTTVVDAMHIMHDSKSLHLPVVRSTSDSQALGLIDVLSLSYGSFAKGTPSDWKSFWESSLEVDDDGTASVSSGISFHSKSGGATTSKENTQKRSGDARPVSKLLPTPATTVLADISVREAAIAMKAEKADSALVVSREGGLLGILTDTDVTRRVVALGNEPDIITVEEAMTGNPKFVQESDSAMDAMFLMLEGKFRHLPVVDAQRRVVGMLKIQKCLYDAIRRLDSSVMQKQGLMSPSLQSIIDGDKSFPPLVNPTDSILQVARQMATSRKAALVVSGPTKQLVGILTPKDVLLRLVGGGLNISTTCVGDIMTKNPESVDPSMTVLDALHIMHENNFLNLPVVHSSSGKIVGLVDVLSLSYGSFSKGTDEEWQTFWDMTLSAEEKAPSVSGSLAILPSQMESQKILTVEALRPSKVTLLPDNITVAEAATRLRRARVEACIIVNTAGSLMGILTPTDVTRRVLAQDIDPTICLVSKVMTASPTCVRTTDPATDALNLMLQGQFKHLPVLDVNGRVSGLLDISKCLQDAIAVMERSQTKADAFADELKRGLGHQDTAAKWIETMRRPTVSMAVEKNMPPPIVGIETPVREAAKMMGSSRTAAVVMDGPLVIGMVTPKDLLKKLIARSLSAETTRVGDVMTPHPITMPPTASILEGLNVMKETRELFVPIVDPDTKRVVGMADVLCLTFGQFGSTDGPNASEWKTFWQSAMTMQEDMGQDDIDDTCSVGTIEDFERTEGRHDVSVNAMQANMYSELGDSVSVISASQSTSISIVGTFLFKVKDHMGHVHRIRCRYESLKVLQDEIRSKMNLQSHIEIILKYEDDEGDVAIVSSDSSLMEAVHMASESKWKSLLLLVDVIGDEHQITMVDEEVEEIVPKIQKNRSIQPVPSSQDNTMVLIGISVGVAIIGIIAMISLKK